VVVEKPAPPVPKLGAGGIGCETAADPPAGCLPGAVFGAAPTSTGMPGNVWRDDSPTTTAPATGTKRTIRLMSRGGPPASSQGSHTL